MNKPTWWTLTELLDRPELLIPPAIVIPRFVWEGRVTLYASREKDGKSTLARQGVTALAQGASFLGEAMAPANVAWLCLDEPMADLVRGLHENGAGHGIVITDTRPGLGDLEARLKNELCRALIVDTWLEFSSGIIADGNSASETQPLLAALRGIAQRTGCGILLLHHLNKAGTGYADSRQLGAGVDVIIEMHRSDDPPTRRTFKVRGRGVHGDFSLDWNRDEGYHLSVGELSLDARILAQVGEHPGIGLGKLRQIVGGANADKDAALRGLLYRGAIVDSGDSSGHRYFTAGAVQTDAQTTVTRRQGHGKGVAA
jgi:hypothetical protein